MLENNQGGFNVRELQCQPQLIQIDPHLIKFNPANPRKHRGTELLKLRRSIEEVGVVQMPTIRKLPGEFYECIDGEGRVLIAQENHQKTIWGVSFGMLSNHEASTMLQAANTVRSFGFLAECLGLTRLHRQGDSIASLADRFCASKSLIRSMIGVGYFPDELHTLMLDDIAQSEEHASRWTQRLLFELLPLRQELAGIDPVHARMQGLPLYDYT